MHAASHERITAPTTALTLFGNAELKLSLAQHIEFFHPARRLYVMVGRDA
jgi:hypothetical protein